MNVLKLNTKEKRPCGAFSAFLELMTRVELVTCGLRYRCSAIEPHQQKHFLLYSKSKKNTSLKIYFYAIENIIVKY